MFTVSIDSGDSDDAVGVTCRSGLPAFHAVACLNVPKALEAALVILCLVRNTRCARLFRLLLRSKAS